jgi:hypothetical protein
MSVHRRNHAFFMINRSRIDIHINKKAMVFSPMAFRILLIV